MNAIQNLSFSEFPNTHSSNGLPSEFSALSQNNRNVSDLWLIALPSGSSRNIVLFKSPSVLGSKPPLDERVSDRMKNLADVAREENIDVSENSKSNLLDFLTRPEIKKIPSLYLLENGNFRAVWAGSEGRQVAAQFRPDSAIQYVIFGPRNDEFVSRSAGRATVDGFWELVLINKAKDLMGI